MIGFFIRGLNNYQNYFGGFLINYYNGPQNPIILGFRRFRSLKGTLKEPFKDPF